MYQVFKFQFEPDSKHPWWKWQTQFFSRKIKNLQGCTDIGVYYGCFCLFVFLNIVDVMNKCIERKNYWQKMCGKGDKFVEKNKFSVFLIYIFIPSFKINTVVIIVMDE
jgi:hypothetical protein